MRLISILECSDSDHMAQRIRTVFFWLHLATGVAAGVIVFIMSVTGVVLTFEKQLRLLGRHPPHPADAAAVRGAAAARRTARPRPGRRAGRLSPARSPCGATRGSGRAHRRSGRRRLRRSLHRPAARPRRSPRLRLLPRRTTGTASCGRPVNTGHRQRDHRRRQSGLPLHRPVGRVPVVAAHVDWAGQHVVGSAAASREGARLQLAQHDRRLVRRPAGDRRRSGVVISYPWAGNLVYRIAGGAPPRRCRRRGSAKPGSRLGWRARGPRVHEVKARRADVPSRGPRRRGPRDADAVARCGLGDGTRPPSRLARHHAPPARHAGADARLHDRRRRPRPAAVSRDADRRPGLRRGREMGRLRGRHARPPAAVAAPLRAYRRGARPARPGRRRPGVVWRRRPRLHRLRLVVSPLRRLVRPSPASG